MRTRLLSLFALAACCALMAAPSPIGRVSQTATGQGGISFGEEGHGKGMFNFSVEGGTGPRGELLFADEDHHSYPDIVVRVNEVLKVDVHDRTVRILARGHLQDTPVDVVVIGVDNVGTGDPDQFSIETTSLKGDGDEHEHFHASGKLIYGDIQVGAID